MLTLRTVCSLLFLSLAQSVFAQNAGTCFNFEDTDPSGQPAGWTAFNVGNADVNWSSSSDLACDGGASNNWAGQIGEFGCFHTPVGLEGQGTDAYLCSPEMDFSTDELRQVEFSFRTRSPSGSQAMLLEVLFGDEVPDLTSIDGYSVVYSSEGVSGGRLIESIEMPATSDAGHICFRYSSEFDGNAAIDNVESAPPSCLPSDIDTDGDRVSDAVDNCLVFANEFQQDTNGDGFGNACDTDLNQDCVTNFADLGLLRQAFFATGINDADFNSDTTVSFVDLGIMRQLFFTSPGPSSQASCP